ncbi:hypothetical protein M9H77_28256 [Catharanthus roseus]|uniref:Uncharacterized protein n=1 Tax=Catharanthus roseus TaxID=4058 RepID=A0ACC0AHJ1_CATRO|nr:hypothetical protein M9H77_28256 [Catharanthus roseus]
MARKKVKLAFIANGSKRKATYMKWKKGLLNQVSELTTLCGINACAIIYSKYDLELEVWPSTIGVQQVISQFKSLPDMEKCKRIMNQEAYLRKRIEKLKEQVEKQLLKNREKDVLGLIFHCLSTDKRELDNLTPADLDDLERNIKKTMQVLNARNERMGKTVVLDEGGTQKTLPPTKISFHIGSRTSD